MRDHPQGRSYNGSTGHAGSRAERPPYTRSAVPPNSRQRLLGKRIRCPLAHDGHSREEGTARRPGRFWQFGLLSKQKLKAVDDLPS